MSKKKKQFHFHFVQVNLRRVLITAAVCFTIIPATIVGTFSFINAKNAVTAQMEDSAKNSVTLLNQNITQMIDKEKTRLDYLSTHVSAANMTGGGNREILDTLLSQQQSDSGLAQAYVGDKKGHYVYTPQSLIKPNNYNPAKRPWFESAMANPHHIVVNEPYQSELVKDYVVSLSETTTDGEGVVGLDLKLDDVQKISNEVNIGQKGYAFIISSDGKIVAHPSLKPGVKVPDKLLLKRVKQSGHGAFNSVYKGVRKQDVYVTNKDTGWVIVGSLLQSEVESNTNSILWSSIIVGGITAIIAALIALVAVIWIIRPIKNLISVAKKVANKDLTAYANTDGFEEFKHLGIGFNQMIDSLSDVLSHVDEKATALASSSEELTASTEENKATSDEVAHSIQDIAAGAQDQNEKVDASKQNVTAIYKEIENILMKAGTLRDKSDAAMGTVNSGKVSLNQVTGQIKNIRSTNNKVTGELNDLVEKMELINYTNSLINDIAAQTHLLSLNAAIEAARAGEQGKGFSVVAAEIQKLANQSSDSSKKIAEIEDSILEKVRELVQSMQTSTEQVDQGIIVADEATKTFTSIEETVTSVSEAANEVNHSVQTISGATGEIVNRIDDIAHLSETASGLTENVSAAAEQQSASMEEIAHNATSLSALADELRQIASQFVINKN
ncbi:methyl-accepting chemotaxis protein [Sporolactobacillus sp. STSJ-5]|uniref:methyl-accepting chemotaxis protein n=1 Tax=Sporolactobacillus sp. STSJ-5 TaxID=2965076 RepID=UPI002104EEA3|nr:methyl-accepting chemotaxis protein [Sporolactobacillus sp. STSJ-5]MCQ2010454.1 methyl-accepting chemotaxis protein [Sporolactobacillus sp. STSJ-5]